MPSAVGERCVATIVTRSFLPYASVLRDSLIELDPDVDFVALVVDSGREDIASWVIGRDALEDLPRAKEMSERYGGSHDSDSLRWALKSQLLLWCLRNGARKVFWCDPDVMFFEKPGALFDMIGEKTVLLSPHYRAFRPSTDERDFQKNFTEGMFQGGFLGIGQGAVDVLDWWAEACLWRMKKDPAEGVYDDQKFLDALPILWPETVVLRHRGCNVAEWNWHESHRGATDGRVVINGTDPIVFIHFTDYTNYEILFGRDTLLRPYLDDYLARLHKYDPDAQLRITRSHFASDDSQVHKRQPQTPWRRMKARVRRIVSS